MTDEAAPLPLQFGANIDPVTDVAVAVARTQLAEALGFDLAMLQDHAYNARFVDTWTLIAILAARTERIRLGPNVLTLPLRLPTMIAKSAVTIDRLASGRLVLGLGAGAFGDGIRGMGGTFPERPGERLQTLREAIAIVRGLLASNGAPFSYHGAHYRAADVSFGPAPAGPIPIWTGVVGPRALGLTGELADGVLVSTSYVPFDALPAVNERIDEGARAAGRDPTEICRAYNVMGRLTLPDDRSMRPRSAGILWGDAAYWSETLTMLATTHRIDTFVFWPAGDRQTDQLRAFAAQVIPAVRAERP